MTKRLWAAIIGACAVVGALCIWFGFIRSPEQRPGGGDQVPSITRAVLEEGQQHFSSADEAVAWLAGRRSTCVWTGDGLVVGWSKNTARKQLNVEVWQIYINGAKPNNLAGAQDANIVRK